MPFGTLNVLMGTLETSAAAADPWDVAARIAVTGTGTLDGQGDNAHWWPWKGSTDFGWKPGDPNQAAARTRLMAMATRSRAGTS